MKYKIKATITCRQCSLTKFFDADANIGPVNNNDGEDLSIWANGILRRVALDGLCPQCSRPAPAISKSV